MNKLYQFVALALLLTSTPASAYDFNDQLSIGGMLAGSIQCQELTDAPGFSNTCESQVPFLPEFSFRPTEADEVFFKLGFTAANGLNERSPFELSSWAAVTEDDLKYINGRNRDTLLTAWYKYTFKTANDSSLGATFGIIDATAYLDENAYANDEYTQFMNAALTNGPNVFLPSYDIGAALEWEIGTWDLRAVLMDIGENDDGNEYDFYGLQAGYHVNSSLGTGNYRLVIARTSKDFLNAAGTRLENRESVLLSLDQELGEKLGAFVRLGWQSDKAAVEHEAIYSGGIDIKGSTWGRNGDNIGVGYAYLSGGSLDIENSQVAEAYYRWQMGEVFALTADIQYQQNEYKTATGPSGLILGLRATSEF